MIPQPEGRPDRLRLGFACRWRDPRELTWSGSAFHLLDALSAECDVTDLPVAPTRPVAAALRRAERLGLTGGTPWAMTPLEDWRAQRQLTWDAARRQLDAVLQIGDLGVTKAPFYVYLDLTYELALSRAATSSAGGTGASFLPPTARSRKLARQQLLLSRAAGIFTMGSWVADDLVGSGFPASRVHVVGAGCNVLAEARLRTPDPTALRMLFLGRDFIRKGGDAVVDALAVCRARGDQHLLTVAGPPRWPLRGPVPEGVHFLGPVEAETASELLRQHDLLLMPSRFEAFGIALLEALASGMPVIARRAFAMPELVPAGQGELVEEADPEQLAKAIRRVAEDGDIWQRCFLAASTTRSEWSWRAVALRMLGVIA